ncbi:putative RGS domain protein [Mollisia scopiformis]|uniref:Putative RGS domain protein n=1 Tax=Mollisia scopiformis TaxID=149040 RepID=A0A194XVA9_MOLSC|nr:putative RGS domain protein [Mollisia scopiformis]KUJ24148.1 putative RGS domain protein [Mollisia scopiformis]
MASPYSPEPAPDLTRNRLPTLFEVLARRTLAPVDLYFFYIYMRDQKRAVDYLDFWLDVAQHMSMCRLYVRDLRRSLMVGTPDGDKTASKRSSALLENIGNLDHRDPAGPSMLKTEKNKNQDAQMSAFLREENGNGLGHSPSGSTGSNMRQTSSNDRPRPSFMSSPQVLTSDSNSPEHEVKRADIRSSALNIMTTYILQDALRQIIIPQPLVEEMIYAIEQQGRDDPEVFDAAKDYVFQAMERDAFPDFLRAKALGNLTPPSLLYRLILGLLGEFAGVWAGSVLCMTGASRATRAWLIIPFTIGMYGLVCWEFVMDPLLAFLGYSEYEPNKVAKAHEPYVRKLLARRSLSALVWWIVFAAGFSCLFIFVPSHYLGEPYD